MTPRPCLICGSPTERTCYCSPECRQEAKRRKREAQKVHAPEPVRPAPKRPKQAGGAYVYFMWGETTDLVKIGTSLDPARLQEKLQLHGGQPVTLLAAVWRTNAYEEEEYLQDQFAADRQIGEWFSFTPDLGEVINHYRNWMHGQNSDHS